MKNSQYSNNEKNFLKIIRDVYNLSFNEYDITREIYSVLMAYYHFKINQERNKKSVEMKLYSRFEQSDYDILEKEIFNSLVIAYRRTKKRIFEPSSKMGGRKSKVDQLIRIWEKDPPSSDISELIGKFGANNSKSTIYRASKKFNEKE